jgi:hypothetical protein
MRQWRSDDTSAWSEGFGKGGDGSTYAAPAIAGCSGTASSTTLTIDAASTFENGDLILIHQTRGSNADSTTAGVVNWELNKIVSGGGTTTLTLAYSLDITYVDSGDSQSQVIEMKEYENLSLSGTITPAAWDGNKGGIGGFFNKGTLSGSSAILNLNGNNGTVGNGTQNPTNGGGFRGGRGTMNGKSSSTSHSGEGTGGASSVSTGANGNGGGAGTRDDHQGGSGAHASTGATGTGGGTGGGANGTGGAIRGVAEMTRAVMGGGGGGGQEYQASRDNGCSSGGNGGGLWFIFSEDIDLSGTTTRAKGGSSPNTYDSKGAGAGGAGGGVLYKCVTATLGTNKTTATGGVTGTDLTGNGSTGRIHIDYSDSISGTTSPTLSSRKDATIKAGESGNFFAFM